VRQGFDVLHECRAAERTVLGDARRFRARHRAPSLDRRDHRADSSPEMKRSVATTTLTGAP
jgi:hypothetical protein